MKQERAFLGGGDLFAAVDEERVRWSLGLEGDGGVVY